MRLKEPGIMPVTFVENGVSFGLQEVTGKAGDHKLTFLPCFILFMIPKLWLRQASDAKTVMTAFRFVYTMSHYLLSAGVPAFKPGDRHHNRTLMAKQLVRVVVTRRHSSEQVRAGRSLLGSHVSKQRKVQMWTSDGNAWSPPHLGNSSTHSDFALL